MLNNDEIDIIARIRDNLLPREWLDEQDKCAFGACVGSVKECLLYIEKYIKYLKH